MSPGAKRALTLTADTVIPISSLGAIVAVVFWVAGLAAKVDAHEKTLDGQGEHEMTAQAAIVRRLDANAEMASELKVQLAGLDAKVSILLQRSEVDRRHK